MYRYRCFCTAARSGWYYQMSASTWEVLRQSTRPVNNQHLAYHFVTNTAADRTKKYSIIRVTVFGHVRRLPEQVAANAALRLTVDTIRWDNAGRTSDNRKQWKTSQHKCCPIPRGTSSVTSGSRLWTFCLSPLCGTWPTIVNGWLNELCRLRVQSVKWVRH